MARRPLNYPKELANTPWASSAYLKAYYKFTPGSELLDQTAGDHDLTAIGVPIQGTPRWGGAVGLGTSQAFSAEDGADFQPAGNFSISAWIKTVGVTRSYIFQSLSVNTNITGFALNMEANGTIIIRSGKNTGTTWDTDGKYFTSTNSVNNGNWHHIVGTYDGAKLHIYIDGAEEGTGVAWTNAAAYAATNYVRVGCRNETGTNISYFQGALDEVVFFGSDALSLTEVQTLNANSIESVACAAIKAKAKAVYDFEESAMLVDSSGNNHVLTAIGAPTTLTNKFGGSIFLGNSSAYTIVDHADFQPTTPFTIGGWIKTNDSSSQRYIFQSWSINPNYAGIAFAVSTTGKLQAYSGKNSGTTESTDFDYVVGNTSVDDGNWHFVVYTWDGSYLRVYLDGVSDAAPIVWANAPAYEATNYVRIGGRSLVSAAVNTFMTGSLDDVFLLNGYALNDTEVYLLYNGRNTAGARTVSTSRNSVLKISRPIEKTNWIKHASLKAYYKFDANNSTYDSSGNSHTLTAIGDPAIGTGKFGDGVVLDGNDAYSAVDHADLKPTGNFSIGAWFKRDVDATYSTIFQSYSINTNYAGILIYIQNAANGNTIATYSGKNTGTTNNVDYKQLGSITAFTDGNWHFMVYTWDGNTLRLYVDGNLNNSVAWANAPAYAATNYVRIGARNRSGGDEIPFWGSLDDVFLLNGTALTLDEVAFIYSGGRNPVV